MTNEEIIEFCEMKAGLEPENEDIYEAIIHVLEQEPKKGHWIEYSWNDNGLARWGLECDKCHKKYKYGGEIWNNPNFCPNCGADMREREE